MKKRDTLLLLISGFILVVAWVGFSIYHSFATSTVSEPLGKQIQPIPASFDTKSIQELKKRKQIVLDLSSLENSASNSSQPTPSPVPSISPTATPALVATTSATTATEGGSLNQ